ncbi:MAG: CpsD/CapB family tyrosine-protein kinase [Faecalibacterium sp.]
MKQMKVEKIPQLPFDVSEALNQLRVNLSFCGNDVKTIMITSSIPNEGKSFIIMHLWKMIAELGTPALLLDCDFRKSELRTRYGFSFDAPPVGSAHYLAGHAQLEDVIYETNIPNGYIIPVIKTVTNPTILLENPRFTDMMEKCRDRFGVILVDTPPLGNVADALNIATHCDGTVLVIRSGQTSRKLVNDSLQQLRRTEKPLLGVVLNRAETNHKSNRYYYKRYYYKSGYYRDYKNNESEKAIK